MADTRKITIQLMTGKTEEEKKAEAEEREKKKQENLAKKAAKAKQAFISYSVKKATDLATQALQTGMDRYFSLTEDYIAQNDIRVAMNMINQTVSFATSIGAGIALGGPAGGIIAGVAWAGNKAINTISGYSELRQGINQNNYNMQFQRVRMGLVDNGRGTEN